MICTALTDQKWTSPEILGEFCSLVILMFNIFLDQSWEERAVSLQHDIKLILTMLGLVAFLLLKTGKQYGREYNHSASWSSLALPDQHHFITIAIQPQPSAWMRQWMISFLFQPALLHILNGRWSLLNKSNLFTEFYPEKSLVY